MILYKYIAKELVKNQLIILIILFLVSVCQKFIKMLNLLICDSISLRLIFTCIGLNIPELGKLIIPFSTFISVPVTLYRLHIHNEILAMYVCGIDKCVVIRSILFFTGIMLIFSGINMFWLSPYCGCYQNKLLSKINNNTDLFRLTEKKFQSLGNQNLVLFIDNIQEKKLNQIFLMRKSKNTFTIIVAEQGEIYHVSNTLKLITLMGGVCYEIYSKRNLHEDICISNFLKYWVYFDQKIETLHIKHKTNDMYIHQLWHSLSDQARIELHWRLTLLISIVVLPIITALLFINIASDYLLSTIFVIFFCVIFFILHIFLRFCIFIEINNLIMWIWGSNIFYFLIAGILYIWNPFYVKRIFL